MPRPFASATCPLCQTYFDRLPVEGDEDGGCYVALPVTPCSDCGAMLCVDCPQFTCESCDETFCESHARLVRCGVKDEVWKCCAACAADILRQAVEDALQTFLCEWCAEPIRGMEPQVKIGAAHFHTRCEIARYELGQQREEEGDIEDAALPTSNLPRIGPHFERMARRNPNEPVRLKV